MQQLLKEKYQYILEEKLLDEIIAVGRFQKVSKGVPLIDIGDKLTHMPLILSGAIKVMSEDEDSNEYLLYYLEIGDSCTMTMNCCMRQKKSSIRAIAELDTQLVLIPIQKMQEWIVTYDSWRAYVFESYDTRIKELLTAVDALAFHNLQERLYMYLKDKAMVLKSPSLDITHYEIANDLNTSRVVISRLMKKLMLDKKIETHRYHVTILELMPKT